MNDIRNLPLGEVIRYAEFGRDQMLAQMQMQMNYNASANPFLMGLGLGFLNTPSQYIEPQRQARRNRRTTDAELDQRFKQLTIDLEARRK